MRALLDTNAFADAIDGVVAKLSLATDEGKAEIKSSLQADFNPQIDALKASRDEERALIESQQTLIENLQKVIQTAIDHLNPATGGGVDANEATAVLTSAPVLVGSGSETVPDSGTTS